jgi:hypothetical protein
MAPAHPPLYAQLVIGRGRRLVADFNPKDFGRRQQIIGEGAVNELALLVKHQPLVKGIADSLAGAASLTAPIRCFTCGTDGVCALRSCPKSWVLRTYLHICDH